MRCERGQATIEWVGLVLLASLVLGALALVVRRGRRPLLRRLSEPPDRVRGAGRGLRRSRARARVRRLGRRAGAPATRRAWSTSPASASCRSTSAAAARWPAPRRPTTATSTPTAPTPGAGPPCSRASSAAAGTPTSSTGSTTPTRTRPCSGPTRSGSGRSATCRSRLLRLRGAIPAFTRDDWEGHQVRIDRDGTRRRALHLARPLPVVQAGRVPRPLGAAHGLDPRVAGSHAGHIPLDRGAGPGARSGGRPLDRAGRATAAARADCASAPPRRRASAGPARDARQARLPPAGRRAYAAVAEGLRRARGAGIVRPLRGAETGSRPPGCRVESIDTSTVKGRRTDGADGPRAAGQAA